MMVSAILGSSCHTNVQCSAPDWLRRVYIWELKSMAPTKTLAPNDVKITIWRRPYPGYFGFTSVQWEEAEAGCPS